MNVAFVDKDADRAGYLPDISAFAGPGYARLVHMADLTAPEQRVLGCLIEKRWTTPDQYPLSLNGLRLACNQSTNRDPVTTYDGETIRAAAQRLSQYGLARLASGHSSRAIKYRHLAEEALGLNREQLAVLAVLLLRGAQTPGELKSRTERMAAFDSLAGIQQALVTLVDKGYAVRLGRRPGQKEDRYQHLLGGEGSEPAAAPAPAAPATPPAPAEPETPAGPKTPANGNLAQRVADLETEVASLRTELAILKEARELAPDS